MGNRGRGGRTLSVALFVNDPPARVAAVLDAVRPVCDEVVVLVDASVDPDRLAPVCARADVVLRAEWPGTLEATLPWLHRRCHGDWVLRVDGDEVPSRALMRRLARLDELDDVVAAWVRRAWLWPDAGRVLAGSPWWPDPQLRLVRNDPKLVRFAPAVHLAPEVCGPVAYLDEPIYHAQLLVCSGADRRAKAQAYERLQPGLRANGGVAQNGGFYRPEVAGRRLVTRTVSAEDHASLEAVLSAREPTALLDPATTAVPLVSSRTIVAIDPGRPLAGADYDVELAFTDSAPDAVAGSTILIEVGIKNLGGACLGTDPPHRAVRLGARWRAPDGSLVVADGLRQDLPRPLPPRGETTVLVHLPVPLGAPGRYELEVDLVHEHVRWFGRPVRRGVQVRIALSAAIVADIERAPSGERQRDATDLLHLLAVDQPDVRAWSLAPSADLLADADALAGTFEGVDVVVLTGAVADTDHAAHDTLLAASSSAGAEVVTGPPTEAAEQLTAIAERRDLGT